MKKQLLSLIVAVTCIFAPLTVRADMYDQQREANYTEVKANTVYESDYLNSDDGAGLYKFVAPENGAYKLDIIEGADSSLYTYVNDPEKFDNSISEPIQCFVANKGKPVYFYVGSFGDAQIKFKVVSIDFGINTLQTICKPYGESVKLTVDVFNGTDKDVKYTWKDEDLNIIASAQGSDSLTIKVNTNTIYYCDVSVGDVEFQKLFDIQVDNELSVSFDDNEVEYNKPYTIKPEIKAKDMSGMQYKWYWEETGEEIEGATGPTFTIDNVDKTYSFYFEVIDKYNNFSGCYLSVYPKLLVRGDDSADIPQIFVDYNGNATITADYKLLDGKKVGSFWEVYNYETERYDVVKENSDKLELKNVKESNMYYFNVKFENGETQFLAYEVIVNNDIKVSLGEDVYIKKGDTVELKADIKGGDLDDSKITWYVKDVSENDEGEYIEFRNNSDTLTLTDIQGDRKVIVSVVDKHKTEFSDEINIIIGEKPTPTPATGEKENRNSDIKNFVDRIYKFVLGRDPEEEGAKFWADELYKFNRSGAEVAQGFIFSQEFIDRKTSDNDFVTILYKTFFDRDPDDDGMKYWLDQLATGTMDRATVANGFIFSQEWADTCAKYGIRSGGDKTANVEIKPTDATYAFVERMYTTAMKRESDKDGKEYWAKELSNFHCTGEFVGAAFFLSEEMTNMKLDDKEFLTRLYATFMDREPDSDGMTYWLGVLSQGSNRSDVVFGFTRSPEFTDKCIAARILPF